MKTTIIFMIILMLSACSFRYSLVEFEREDIREHVAPREKQCFSYFPEKGLEQLDSCGSEHADSGKVDVILSKTYIARDVSPGMLVFLGMIPAINYYIYKAEILSTVDDEKPYCLYFTVVESWSSLNSVKNVLSSSKSLSELEKDIVNEIDKRIGESYNKNSKERSSGQGCQT